jgi:hypothetical protein
MKWYGAILILVLGVAGCSGCSDNESDGSHYVHPDRILKTTIYERDSSTKKISGRITEIVTDERGYTALKFEDGIEVCGVGFHNASPLWEPDDTGGMIAAFYLKRQDSGSWKYVHVSSNMPSVEVHECPSE